MKRRSANQAGVIFKEHPTRKHGVKKDRYYIIRYQRDGKRTEEGLGWASEGWTADSAAYELAQIKKAHRTGEGPQSLAEKRQIEEERRKAEEAEAKAREKENITFGHFFEHTYQPILEVTKKPGSVNAEKILFNTWLKPVIGAMPFRDIVPLHFERVKKNMLAKGRAPRSIEYALALARQVWNMAKRDGLTTRDCPTKQVKKPRIDNKRLRFLSREEADRLLKELAPRSQQLHDMALLSLHTGMRAGEIFKLKWQAVKIDQDLIYIMDAKAGSRTAHMTNEVKEMFKRLAKEAEEAEKEKPEEEEPRPAERLVFTDREGQQITQMSKTFERAVADLKLNANPKDKRQRVLFHTLRHTFASWLVEAGEPLYTVQKLMGHASIALTERYSHLAPDTLKSAVTRFEQKWQEGRKANGEEGAEQKGAERAA